MTQTSRLLPVLAALTLFACPPQVKPLDTTKVSKVIGANGGTLSHPTGATLTIPAGALASDTELSIEGAAAPAEAELGAKPLGQAFIFGPEGQQFLVPITAEIPGDPALLGDSDTDDIRLFLSPQSPRAFVELQTTLNEKQETATAQLTHFSIIVPGVAQNPATFSFNLPDAVVGQAYSAMLTISGGVAPYTFAFVDGTSPGGLELDSTGLISGTPVSAGDFWAVVEVTMGNGSKATAVLTLHVTGGATCTTMLNDAPVVTRQLVAAAAPSPQGGTMGDGVWVLRQSTVYTGVGGRTGPDDSSRQKLSLAGSAVETANQRTGEASEGASGTAAFSGTQFTLTRSCPSASTVTGGYTATSDSVSFFVQGADGLEVSLWLREGATFDAGTLPEPDAGTTDAGSSVEALTTGLTELVDLTSDATTLYALGDGKVVSCPLTGCTTATQVTTAFASSILVVGSTLFATTNFNEVSSCTLPSCTLAQFVSTGANTYPAHLAVANGTLYWLAENGANKEIHACALTGCASPTVLYSGTAWSYSSGLAAGPTDLYVSSFTGGVFHVPLTSALVADTANIAQLSGSAYGTGGLLLDGSTLKWAEANDNLVRSCTLPACGDVTTVLSGLSTPSGLDADATYLYGADRGTPNGSGGYVAGTARLWRAAK